MSQIFYVDDNGHVPGASMVASEHIRRQKENMKNWLAQLQKPHTATKRTKQRRKGKRRRR